jgi:sortase A
MEPRVSLKHWLFIGSIIGILFYAFLLTASKAKVTLPTLPIVAKETRVSLPISLKIPSLKIDTTIEYVGLTPQGEMDVPKKPGEVAWLFLGPRPGEKGSAVIAGHSGRKNNAPAIFDNLSQLQKGDKIYVEDVSGGTSIFVVQKFQTYALGQAAPEVFSSSDGKAHLNLITCSGTWSDIWQTHSSRLVVFTEKE